MIQNHTSSERRFSLFTIISLSLLITIISFTFLDARAEYRVYQYYVQPITFNQNDPNSYRVVSTLDPISYIAYHGGAESIRIDMISTWICKGHTGNRRELCPSPLEQFENQQNNNTQ